MSQIQEIDQAVMNKVRATQKIEQDRTRVFGYHGGTPLLTMDAKSSGLPCNPIWGQKLLPFYPNKNGYLGALDTMTGKRKTLHVELMPNELAYQVDSKFHLNDDHGIRILSMLTQLPYEVRDNQYFDEGYDYFNVVHPHLTDCEFGLFRDMSLSDPEVGESTPVWQPCPTCRLANLKSEATGGRIFQASSEMDSKILSNLRDLLVESNEATLRHVERKSAMISSDIAKKMTGSMPGRNVLNTVDGIHLRMMHKSLDKGSGQSDLAKIFAQALMEVKSSQPPAPVQEGGLVLSAEEAEFYRQQLAKRKEAQERMAKARNAKKEGQDETNVETQSDN